ncbi:TIGR02186 family protein [Aureimonas sp. OT7]|uniref:TIGR02186 family protein n=1 Tax=Aureimonas TaxID=414371 RepID=UPI00177FF254|nr:MULTISPECIES: TIGR02186 family protein [Aureimonas]QOG06159.1 TIGR02186 family protein [Aureimonas sp. OT7]
MRAILAALALLLAAAAPAAAQTPTEGFEIGLSTDTITVGTNFGGSRLVVFGALDNADTRVLRQGRYDIVVVLEGPRRNVVVRQRDRVFGIWINRGSERFDNLPQSYALSSSRPLRDTAAASVLQQLNIGPRNEVLRAQRSTDDTTAEADDYANAMLRLKEQSRLYSVSFGTIEFVSQTLFRATLVLPPDLPVGRHLVRAYLFREGQFIRERSEELWVRKTGLENEVSTFAANYGALYGLLAVALAVATGWFGRVLFKRD